MTLGWFLVFNIVGLVAAIQLSLTMKSVGNGAVAVAVFAGLTLLGLFVLSQPTGFHVLTVSAAGLFGSLAATVVYRFRPKARPVNRAMTSSAALLVPGALACGLFLWESV